MRRRRLTRRQQQPGSSGREDTRRQRRQRGGEEGKGVAEKGGEEAEETRDGRGEGERRVRRRSERGREGRETVVARHDPCAQWIVQDTQYGAAGGERAGIGAQRRPQLVFLWFCSCCGSSAHSSFSFSFKFCSFSSDRTCRGYSRPAGRGSREAGRRPGRRQLMSVVDRGAAAAAGAAGQAAIFAILCRYAITFVFPRVPPPLLSFPVSPRRRELAQSARAP